MNRGPGRFIIMGRGSSIRIMVGAGFLGPSGLPRGSVGEIRLITSDGLL
jgi:hypothetical protein